MREVRNLPFLKKCAAAQAKGKAKKLLIYDLLDFAKNDYQKLKVFGKFEICQSGSLLFTKRVSSMEINWKHYR